MSTARDSWLALPEHTTAGTRAMPGRPRAQRAQKVFSQPTKLSQVLYDTWIYKQTKNAAPPPPPRAHLIPPKPGLMLKSWSSIRSSCSDLVRGDLVMSELRFRIGLPQRESGRSRCWSGPPAFCWSLTGFMQRAVSSLSHSASPLPYPQFLDNLPHGRAPQTAKPDPASDILSSPPPFFLMQVGAGKMVQL